MGLRTTCDPIVWLAGLRLPRPLRGLVGFFPGGQLTRPDDSFSPCQPYTHLQHTPMAKAKEAD